MRNTTISQIVAAKPPTETPRLCAAAPAFRPYPDD